MWTAAAAWERVPATSDTRTLFSLTEQARLHPRHDLTQVRSRNRYGIVSDGEGRSHNETGYKPVVIRTIRVLVADRVASRGHKRIAKPSVRHPEEATPLGE